MTEFQKALDNRINEWLSKKPSSIIAEVIGFSEEDRRIVNIKFKNPNGPGEVVTKAVVPNSGPLKIDRVKPGSLVLVNLPQGDLTAPIISHVGYPLGRLPEVTEQSETQKRTDGTTTAMKAGAPPLEPKAFVSYAKEWANYWGNKVKSFLRKIDVWP